MKNLIISIVLTLLIYAVTICVIYMAFAFATWNINASNWATEARGFLAFLSVALFASAILLCIEIKDSLCK